MASAGADNNDGERLDRDEEIAVAALVKGRICWNARVVVMTAKKAISVTRLSRLRDMDSDERFTTSS